MIKNAAIGRGKSETPNNCGFNNGTYRHRHSAIVILHVRARAAIDPTRSTLLQLPALGDNAVMQTESPKADQPKRKRRWYQFSLRTLMIFTLLCAIPCAWLGRRIERKSRERAAIKEVTAKFGRAQYDYEIANSREANGPAWLRRLLGADFFSEVQAVTLRGGSHNDDDLAVLEELPQVRQLDLQDTNVNDAGLAHLSGLSELVRLNLKDTLVGDAGLEHLKGLTNLEYLSLSGTKVGDAVLSSLKDLTHLKELELDGTAVTDAGARELRTALPHLELFTWRTGPKHRFIRIEGLVAFGFDDNCSYLLAISRSGRSVFSTSTWMQLARDYRYACPVGGYSVGIGPLNGQRIPMVELDSDQASGDSFGNGALLNYASDGIEVVTP